MSLQHLRIPLLLAAGLLVAAFSGPLRAGPAGDDSDLLGAGVLHGTVQARVNDQGDLVIALDRKRSSHDPEDGTADVVFLAAPIGDSRLEAVARALAEPVADATLELPEGRLRLVTPAGRHFTLVTGRGETGVSGEREDTSKATPVLGIARYVVDKRGLTMPGALDAFERFSVVRGSPGQPASESD